MFRFAVQEDLLPVNPFVDVRNRDRQRPRDRVLSMEELMAISRWSAAAPHPWGQFLQLLMLTGARRNEWANAEVSWLDLDAGRLEIPAANYKTGKVQVLPLSTQAKAILHTLPGHEFGPYLISSCGGMHPISGFSKIKRQLDASIGLEKAPLAHWTLHDLRRSMATHMERIGIQPHIIEMCLGHSLRGIGSVYRRYEYLPEKAHALQRWADELSCCVRRGVLQPVEVVPDDPAVQHGATSQNAKDAAAASHLRTSWLQQGQAGRVDQALRATAEEAIESGAPRYDWVIPASH
jgi:integrase